MGDKVKLIVGLGNPGSAYQTTRHNAGAWFVQTLAASFGQNLKEDKKFFGKTCKLPNGVWLLEPTTFMNLSGQALQSLAKFYKLPPETILVCHDELDLEPGVVKLKNGGGHGGHNGLRDIINRLSSNHFLRLRLGIGHPGHRDKVHDFVLHAPSKEEHIAILNAIDRALTITDELFAGELQKAMQTLHS